MRTLLIIAAVMLAGCGTKTYMRAGSTESDFKRDAAQCRVQHNQALLQAKDVMGNLTASTIFRDCMEGKGWERS